MTDARKVDFFPTVDEILNEAPMTKCEQCGREFMNSSACRFHQLKQHLKPDVSETNEKRIVQRNCVEPRKLLLKIFE